MSTIERLLSGPMSSMVISKLGSLVYLSFMRMLALGLARVGAVCAEVLGGVRRICGANNSSSRCRQNLFGGDERVELSAWKEASRSILVDCNSRLIAGGCDGGGEPERQKLGNPKLIKRKRRRKETTALGHEELLVARPLCYVKTTKGVEVACVVVLQQWYFRRANKC